MSEDLIEKLLREAEEFLSEAVRELEEGLREGSQVKVRDACEKAWNAVVQAVNALVYYYTGRVPRSHWERRTMLRDLERRYPELSEVGVYDRYMARYRLHGEVFYEGLLLDPETLRHEFDKVREYLNLVRRFVCRK